MGRWVTVANLLQIAYLRGTFSTPASANTTRMVLEGVAPRLASTSTATLFTGANVSATRHAKMRREKLSMTAGDRCESRRAGG